jgi:hypothetical protein
LRLRCPVRHHHPAAEIEISQAVLPRARPQPRPRTDVGNLESHSKTGAPLNQNHWRTIGATQSLSRFCAIEFRLTKKASMAQRNNADRGIGAAMAQNARLPLRARSALNPLCSIGLSSRLTAPLGQRRTLITSHSLPRQHSTSPDQSASGMATEKGAIELLFGMSALRSAILELSTSQTRLVTSCRRPIDYERHPGLAARTVDSFAALGCHKPAGSAGGRGQSIVPTQRPHERATCGKAHIDAIGDHRPHDGKSRKGVFAHAVATFEPFIGRKDAHARALSAGQVLGATEALAKRGRQFHQSRLRKTRHPCRWGKNLELAQISTSFRYIAQPCSKFWAALSEKVGWPVKGPVLLSGAAQDSLNGPVRWLGSARSQNSPAAVSESRRGMAT